MKRVLNSLWTPWLSAATLILVWLVDVSGGGLPASVRATIAAGCVLVVLIWLVARAIATLRGGDEEEAIARRWALGLLILATIPAAIIGLDIDSVSPGHHHRRSLRIVLAHWGLPVDVVLSVPLGQFVVSHCSWGCTRRRHFS